MTDKQFTFVLRALRDRIWEKAHNREICIEYQPDHPCPDERKAMFIRTEDVDRAILNSFNEIIEDEYTM